MVLYGGPNLWWTVEMDLREGFTAFFTPLQDILKELVKQHSLGIKDSVDVNFPVVDEMSQALETELNTLGPCLHPVD